MARANSLRRLGVAALVVALVAAASFAQLASAASQSRPALQPTDLCESELLDRGSVRVDTTLPAGDYVLLSCNLTVTDGATLTLTSGTTVAFEEGRRLSVNADSGLNVAGDAPGSVRIGSAKPEPAAGDWQGVNVARGAAFVRMKGFELLHSGQAGIRSSGSPVTLEDGRVAENGSHGIQASNSDVVLRNVVVEQNEDAGLEVTPESNEGNAVTIESSTFRENGEAAVSSGVAVRWTLQGNSAEDNGINGISMGAGTMSGDFSWPGGDLPIVPRGSVSVEDGSLSLEPNLIVKFSQTSGSIRLRSNGGIQAVGSQESPIIITSVADDEACNTTDITCDTGNDGTTTPQDRSWQSVQITTEAISSTIQHVDFRYGGQSAMLDIQTENVSVSNSRFYGGGNDGLSVDGVSATVRDSVFEQNRENGIDVSVDDPIELTLEGNTFLSNDNAVLIDGADVEIRGTGNETPGYTNATNGIRLDGDMTVSHTWRAGDLPIVIDSDVDISERVATLTIEPGTVVKLDEDAEIVVSRGELVLGAEDGDRVLVTALTDDACSAEDDPGQGDCDTNGDGAETQPQTGAWRRVQVEGQSKGATLQNGVLRFGGQTNEQQMLLIEHPDTLVRGMEIAYSGGRGIAVEEAAPRIEGNDIHHNSNAGILIEGGDTPLTVEVLSNVIHDNGIGSSDAVGAIEIDTNVELVLDDANRLYREEGTQVNGIVLEGRATNNRRWQKSNLPYVILTQVDFINSATLTIDPGVIVRFDEGARLVTSRGFLEAIGTEEEPIIFTSLADDDNPIEAERTDPGSGDPSAGNWIGLSVPEVVCSGSAEYCGQLEHVEIRYAGLQGQPSLSIEQQRTLLRNSVIRDGAGPAIGIEDADDVQILDNEIENMLGDGIAIEADSSIETTIQGNRIVNTERAVSAEADAQVVLGTDEATRNEVEDNQTNGIVVSGTVRRQRNWTPDDLIWVLEDRISIDGGSLQIAPGAVVKSELEASISLSRGSILIGEPDAERPVLLTGLRDDVCGVDDEVGDCDTNGDGEASTPLPGDWIGITLSKGNSGDKTIINNAVVRYAGANEAAVASDMAWTDIDRLVVERSLTDGLLLTDVGTVSRAATVKGLVARDNRLGTGLRILGDSYATILSAVFTANQRSIEHRSSGKVDFLGNVAINNDFDAMKYCAEVTSTQTWTADITREIDCAVRIVDGATLTIVPGSLLRFGASRSLDVRANALEAEGVLFSAAEGVEEPGAWRGVTFEENSKGFVRHSLFAYGGSSSAGAVEVQSNGGGRSDPVKVEYNTFLRADSTGVSVEEDIYTEIRGNLIRGIIGNRSSGIRIQGEGSTLVERNRIDDSLEGISIRDKLAIITMNNFSGIRGFGVNNSTTANCINAKWNWWGHTQGPKDENDREDRCVGQNPTNPDGQGVEVSNNVLYTPWLRQRQPLMPVVDAPRAGVTNQGELELVGHGNIGDDIRVFDRVGDAEDETEIATGRVGADGTFRIPLQLAAGTHHISVESFAEYAGAAPDAPEELTSPRTGYRQIIVEPATAIDPASIQFRYSPVAAQPPSEIVQPLRNESGASVACDVVSSGRVVIPDGESVIVEAAAEGASALEFVQEGQAPQTMSPNGGVFRSQSFEPVQAPFEIRVAGGAATDGCSGYLFFGGGGRVFEDSGVPGPPLFTEGFEGPDADWVDPDEWFIQAPWGRNSESRNSGTYSMDSNPGGTYGPDREVAIQLKDPVNLQRLVSPELAFHHWYRIASGDEARVEYKLSNSATWRTLAEYSGINNVWSSVQIPLDELGDQPRVYLRWVLDSNADDRVAEGWRVDDISIRSGGALNGRYDEGEPLVPGVRVELLQRNPDSGAFGTWDGGPTGQVNPQVTNDQGRYGFFSLPAGEYRLQVTPQSGQSATVPDTIVIDGVMDIDVPLKAAQGIYLPATFNNASP